MYDKCIRLDSKALKGTFIYSFFIFHFKVRVSCWYYSLPSFAGDATASFFYIDGLSDLDTVQLHAKNYINKLKLHLLSVLQDFSLLKILSCAIGGQNCP